MKKEYNRTVSYSRSTSRLIDAKMNQNVLTSLFSKQFLSNVKNQLSKKSTSTRFIQAPEVKSHSISMPDKIQLQLLTQRIKDLAKENQQLKLLVTNMRGEIKRSQQAMLLDTSRSNSSRTSQKNQLFSTVVQVCLQSNKKEEQQASEIERLKEKISILQLHKTVKQQRISELLQKEVRYESQIRLLRMKENCLESEVKSLKESIKVQLSDFQAKNLARTNNSDINIVMPYANGVEVPSQIQQSQAKMAKMDQLCKNLNIDTCSLIASHCETFQIPQQMHISNLWMKISHKSEINQIDQLLQDELPFVKISADLEAEHGMAAGMFKKGKVDFNNSEIRFDLSQDFNQKPPQIDQSAIKIEVGQRLPTVKRQDSIVMIDL